MYQWGRGRGLIDHLFILEFVKNYVILEELLDIEQIPSFRTSGDSHLVQFERPFP